MINRTYVRQTAVRATITMRTGPDWPSVSNKYLKGHMKIFITVYSGKHIVTFSGYVKVFPYSGSLKLPKMSL